MAFCAYLDNVSKEGRLNFKFRLLMFACTSCKHTSLASNVVKGRDSSIPVSRILLTGSESLTFLATVTKGGGT